jgi:PPOX class probable F420-dependent enzyme
MADDAKLLELIGSRSQGVLAGVRKSGHPHLTNILYVWDAETRTARISTQADRVKGRILRRDPHAALYVPGDHFWAFAVAEGDVTVSEVAREPGDPATEEGVELLRHFYGADLDVGETTARLIREQRIVVRLPAERVYGLVLDAPPGG